MPGRVALIVDHPQRDLGGMVLVAAELCEGGMECALVPMKMQYREVLCLQPDVVLVSYLRRRNEEVVHRFLELGVRVALLDGEGGVIRSAEDYGRILSSRADVREGIGRYLSWGPELADFALREKWFSRDQIDVTGHPRFDLYAEPFATALVRNFRREHGLPEVMVLVTSNFTLANSRFLRIEDEMTLQERQGHSRASLEDRLRAEQASLEGLTHLTRLLAERHPDVLFVYRPHPFEDPAPYGALLADLANVKVISEGSVTPWIMAARVVIHRGSSTAVEAAIGGKLVLEPVWLPSFNESKVLEGASRTCGTPAEVAYAVAEAVTATNVDRQRLSDRLETELYRWFRPIDGQAHIRVARALESLVGEPSERLSPSRFADAMWGLDRPDVSLARRWYRRIGRLLGREPNLSDGHEAGRPDSWTTSPKGFGRQDVEALLAWMLPLLGGAPGAPEERWLEVGCAEPGRDYRSSHGSGLSVVLRRGH